LDNLEVGISLIFMGLTTVFMVLGLLAAVIVVIQKVFGGKNEGLPTAPPTVPKEAREGRTPSSSTSPIVSDTKGGNNYNVVAAIAAVIGQLPDTPTGWKVTSVTPVIAVRGDQQGWASSGRIQIMQGREKRVGREGSWQK